MRFLKKQIGLLTLISIVAAGCVTTPGRDFNLLSTDEEVQLGLQASKQVEEEEQVLKNPRVQAYVKGIGKRLAPGSPRQEPGLEYTFAVIDAPDTVNAFALPGGYMYVYTGLLRLAANEGELASVMAHEIAHVAAYHHGEAISRQIGYEALMGAVLGQEPGPAAQAVAGLFGAGVAASYSREQERQADALGMDILVAAGYNPLDMVSFMRRLLDQEGPGGMPMPIFSSHPPTTERLQRLEAYASRYPPEVRNRPSYEQRYAQNALRPLDLDHVESGSEWKVVGKQ